MNILIAVENPVGYMSTAYQKPSQIIHPYVWRPCEESYLFMVKGSA